MQLEGQNCYNSDDENVFSAEEFEMHVSQDNNYEDVQEYTVLPPIPKGQNQDSNKQVVVQNYQEEASIPETNQESPPPFEALRNMVCTNDFDNDGLYFSSSIDHNDTGKCMEKDAHEAFQENEGLILA